MLISCVAHSTNCCVNNRRWITTLNHVLVHRQHDKMLFQVMKNDHVVFFCAHCHLGLQFLQIELVFCSVNIVFCTTLCVVVLCVDCCVTLGNAAALVY